MDINMPNKDGYEVTQEIHSFYSQKIANQELPHFDGLPIVIACSAFNGEEDQLKGKNAFMSDFVTKPIMKDALDAIITKYFLDPIVLAAGGQDEILQSCLRITV